MRTIKSLVLKDIRFAYENETWVFNDLNAQFLPDKNYFIRARGGQGRSTFLKIIAGLLSPQSGKYLVNGENVLDYSFEEFLPLRLKIGYSFDLGGLLNNRSLLENLVLSVVYHNICSREQAEERARDWAEVFRISELLHQRPSAVTGSARKATCIIRSLIHHPEVLLLDDPSTGLPGEVVTDFFSRLKSLQGQVFQQTLIVSEDERIQAEFQASEMILSEKRLIDEDQIENFVQGKVA